MSSFIESFPCLPSKGYFVDYGRADDQGFTHTFCGVNDTAGAECPNCKKPLYRMYCLDTNDPRLELVDAPFPQLPLLYCWRCNVAQAEFSYALNDDGSVEILAFRSGFQTGDFPYNNYPEYFPEAPLRLKEEVPQDRQTALAWRHLGVPEKPAHYDTIIDQVCDEWGRHQVGGVPFICQLINFAECPRCKACMNVLATVADDNTSPRGFAGNSGVQVIFHFCQSCFVVAADHVCD